MVLVGTIARPHGLRGHVLVNPETDFIEERFKAGEAFWSRSAAGIERLVIQSARVQNGRPVVVFEGYDSVDAAAPLAGRELRIPEDALQPLGEGTYYHYQLVGCEVETMFGDRIGHVVRVEDGAGGALLVVDGAGGEVLIPLAAEICVAIDVGSRRIRVQAPEGLLDLNAARAR
jgi:16S rRNA processing protein RimM